MSWFSRERRCRINGSRGIGSSTYNVQRSAVPPSELGGSSNSTTASGRLIHSDDQTTLCGSWLRTTFGRCSSVNNFSHGR